MVNKKNGVCSLAYYRMYNGYHAVVVILNQTRTLFDVSVTVLN